MIELLVVIAILILLTAITVSVVNFSMTSERIRAAARQMQSYLEGARDRAIYAKEPRGVRYLLDQTNNQTVTSMVFIGSSEPWSDGMLRLERPDIDEDTNGNGTLDPGEDFNNDGNLDTMDGVADGPEIRILRGQGDNGWFYLKTKKLLVDGARIKIPADKNGTWYTISTRLLNVTDEVLALNVPYRDPGTTDVNEIVAFEKDAPNAPGLPGAYTWTYQLELPPSVLPGADGVPVLLPRGIVIDLRGSRLPPDWGPNKRLDVLFSPRGTVIGSPAASGLLHFYLTENVAAEFGLPPDAQYWEANFTYTQGDWIIPNPRNGYMYLWEIPTPPPSPLATGSSGGTQPTFPQSIGDMVTDGAVTWTAFEIGDRLLVSLFTQTGNISSHPIYLVDPPPILGDPPPSTDAFRYATQGEVAGQ